MERGVLLGYGTVFKEKNKRSRKWHFTQFPSLQITARIVVSTAREIGILGVVLAVILFYSGKATFLGLIEGAYSHDLTVESMNSVHWHV